MIKVSDYIARRLAEVHHVKHVFMVSGGGAMHLNDSFGHCKGIEYICNHHEQASAIAAEGYARCNQELAVVNVTTGPGGINALNGVYGQWTDSVPVLYISGQVKQSTTIASCPDIPLRQLGDQEVDIISIVKPIVKYAETVKNIKDVKRIIDKAVYLAKSGRPGPVWVDVPMDIQGAVIDEDDLIDYNPQDDEPKFNSIDSEIEQVIKLLQEAKRPVIVAGHGIRSARSENAFYKLLNTLKIPIVTTMNGCDLIEDENPYYIGRIGTVGQRAGNFALQNADLVLCLGTRNNIRQISYNWENFAIKAKKIVVDIDKAELQKPTVKPDVAIHIDLKDFLNQFISAVSNITFKSSTEWLNWCVQRKEKYLPSKDPCYLLNEKYINPYLFIIELTKRLKENDILVGGNGSAFLCPFQAGIVKKGQRFIWNSGNASMGYDLPAAIGACIANTGKDVICLAGDGSIMMNLQELQTLKHYNLPIKLFILNNDGYSSIKQTQNNFFEGKFVACTSTSGVSLPNFVKIAEAFDLPAVKIDSYDNLVNRLEDILNMKGPVVCEVMLDTDYIFNPKLSARKLEDGSMLSPSLEDMYPFLTREEFEQNIIK